MSFNEFLNKKYGVYLPTLQSEWIREGFSVSEMTQEVEEEYMNFCDSQDLEYIWN
jgi:hypothetical protein